MNRLEAECAAKTKAIARHLRYGGRCLSSRSPNSSVCRECSSEHRLLACRLLLRRFILNDVPMPDEESVLNAHDICGNPVHREAEVRKSPVQNHEVSFGHNHSRFVLKLWRDALDEIEQTLTTRCDMRAVLNVVRRPETLSGCIVPLVEERLEGF